MALTNELLWERTTPYEDTEGAHSCGWSYLLRDSEAGVSYSLIISATFQEGTSKPSDMIFTVGLLSDCCNGSLMLDPIEIGYKCFECGLVPALVGGVSPQNVLLNLGAVAVDLPVREVELGLTEMTERDFYDRYGYKGILLGAELVNTVREIVTAETAKWNNYKVLRDWVQQTMELS